MVHFLRKFLTAAAALLAFVLLQQVALSQTNCTFCNQVERPTPPPPPSVNSNQIAPQIKALQNLTDPIIINIVPGEVVDRSALNTPPNPPVLTILGQGTPGQGGPTNTFPRINGMPPPGENRFVQDEILIFVRGLLTQEQIDRLRALGLSLMEQQTLGSLNVTFYKFHIDNGATVRAAIATVQQAFQFPLTQPNYSFFAVQQAGAPAQQQDDATQYVVAKLRLNEVHRLVRGNNITIAVVDSEIDAAHPDLQGAVAQRYSAVGAPEKPHPHGTGMAGAIGSHQRLVGIAPGARLFAVHAFSTAATSESTTFQILKGIDWSVTQGARVINMSFAGPKDPALERALKAAYDRNIVLVAAVGNAGPRSPPLYPGADPNVIGVTATDENDKIFTGANRGRQVALAAPGVDILVPAPDGAYQLTTGTSVASAEMSGVVALMLERNPNLRPADVKRILTATAKRLGTGARDDTYGAGLVDPLRAVQQAAEPRVSSAAPPRR
jgi:subtilisin family serine protease